VITSIRSLVWENLAVDAATIQGEEQVGNNSFAYIGGFTVVLRYERDTWGKERMISGVGSWVLHIWC